ncbi:hypothetical protein [Moraxella oculi]|uniref:Uncharacterized protein n=1 Tax=Moraxella oculi TaxID=2940516 RepID=A0ABW8U6A3_9GAMM
MAHDASNNNPTKELLASLVGIALLLTMIAGIAISAWLRPAGEHHSSTVALPDTQEAAVASMQVSDAALAEAQEKLDKTPDDTQAPTQATATEDTPAAQNAPADTTNPAPVAETVEEQSQAKAAIETASSTEDKK